MTDEELEAMTLDEIADWHAKMAMVERDEQFRHFHQQAAEILRQHRADVRALLGADDQPAESAKVKP